MLVKRLLSTVPEIPRTALPEGHRLSVGESELPARFVFRVSVFKAPPERSVEHSAFKPSITLVPVASRPTITADSPNWEQSSVVIPLSVE
jgi:hypothetical protein